MKIVIYILIFAGFDFGMLLIINAIDYAWTQRMGTSLTPISNLIFLATFIALPIFISGVRKLEKALKAETNSPSPQ